MEQIITAPSVKCILEGHAGCYESPRNGITPEFPAEKGLREGFLKEVILTWVLKNKGEFMPLENELPNKAKMHFMEAIILLG